MAPFRLSHFKPLRFLPGGRLDRVALAIVVLYALVWVAGILGKAVPGGNFLRFLFFLAALYLLYRGVAWLRREGLWSLRKRLAVAYLFIAVVPLVLLVVMGGLSAYLIYSQLGAHLLHDDLQRRVEKLAVAADVVMNLRAGGAPASSPAIASALESVSKELPGVKLEPSEAETVLDPGRDSFAGVVQVESNLLLEAVIARRAPSGTLTVALSLPLTGELLESVAPELGPIQLTVTRPAASGDPETKILNFADQRFLPIAQIASKQRRLSPPAHWLDVEITGFSNLEAAVPGAGQVRPRRTNPVFVSFSARPSQLNSPLFRSLGGFGEFASTALFVMLLIFLVLEIAALRIGIQLTRQITNTVDELSRATQLVQAGDFTQTVRVQQRDQLGALGESFNEMISSIANLIQEQRQRQRLENELSIAREVQAQLFPQELPKVPGIELAAICRAARVVSGDYYDFVSLGPGRLGFVIADISGKGISAALLMASLQAALRSQVLLDSHSWQNTAELVSRLNQHLFLNTSMDRYATLFYAAFDAETRTLHYTNAGHLPPLYIAGDEVRQLEEGGMVVGLFDDCVHEQGTIHVEPGALLVAYSDGLVECENVYGEEFGRKGIRAELLRRRAESPQRVAEGLVQAAEEWTGSPEQADDMTVIVARLG